MKANICAWSMLALVCSTATWTPGQKPRTNVESPAKLALQMEVATTNDDGSPQALRFTLTNIGDHAVMLPFPSIGCIGEGGRIRLDAKVISGETTGGLGFGCGGSSGEGIESFVHKVRRSWLHLEPGEFLVFTGDRRSMLGKNEGMLTYEYWAEYEPPTLRADEKQQASAEGYLIPTVPIASQHLKFSERWPSEQ